MSFKVSRWNFYKRMDECEKQQKQKKNGHMHTDSVFVSVYI